MDNPLEQIVGQRVTVSRTVHDYIQVVFENAGFTIYNDYTLSGGKTLDALARLSLASVSETAEAVVFKQKALRAAHLREKDVERLPKGAQRKLKVARRLREETTMTLEWIAERLRMDTAGHLSHLLYWERTTKPWKETK
jgi:ABC-type Na+ transport system ATPase subunit NatA